MLVWGREIFRSVQLKIFDILGREVATLVNQKQKLGNYEITWDASNQPSGVYFYQLSVGHFIRNKEDDNDKIIFFIIGELKR